MIGELGRDEPIADAADPDEGTHRQSPAKCADDVACPRREEGLHRTAESARESERGVDPGDVAAALGRGYELPADPRSSGELRLGEPAREPALPEGRGSVRGQDFMYHASILAQGPDSARRLRRSMLTVVSAVALSACGGSSSPAHAGAGPTAVHGAPTVLAAASLTKVFPEIDPQARYTFGGSGALETDIEQGAPADVFAAASPRQPAALLAKGLIDKPVEFATNTLVLIVPNQNPAHITSVADITRPGVKLVICNATVPCGDYARTAFANLGITAAAMKNVVSQTTDVTQTVAEVATGQADAGFVYITDAKAAAGKIKVVSLPAQAKPGTEDVVAVVKRGEHQAAARAFVAGLLSPAGQAKLRAAGFGSP